MYLLIHYFPPKCCVFFFFSWIIMTVHLVLFPNRCDSIYLLIGCSLIPLSWLLFEKDRYQNSFGLIILTYMLKDGLHSFKEIMSKPDVSFYMFSINPSYKSMHGNWWPPGYESLEYKGYSRGIWKMDLLISIRQNLL